MADVLKSLARSVVVEPPSPPNSGDTLTIIPGEGTRFAQDEGEFWYCVAPAGERPTFSPGTNIQGNCEFGRCTITGDTVTLTQRALKGGPRAIQHGDEFSQPIMPEDIFRPPTTVGSMRGYGTSLLRAATHIDIASDRYFSKVAEALHAKAQKNYGVGGSRLLTQVVTAGWALTWTHTVEDLIQPAPSLAGLVRPAREGLQILHHGINDMGQFGNPSENPNWATTFYYALLASVHQVRAGFVWQPFNGAGNGRFTTIGWSGVNDADFGGNYVKHGAGSTTIKYTTESGHPGGDMVFYIAQSIKLGESCVVSATIKPSGGSVGPTLFTLDTLGIGVVNIGGATGPATPIPLLVPNVPSGAGNEVTLTFSTIRTNINFLGATLESEWPPLVLILNQPFPLGNPSNVPPSTWPNATAQVITDGNTMMENVASLFPDGKVTVVDLHDMDGQAHYWIPGDDLHYNPDGHAHVADLVMAEIDRVGGIPIGYSAGPDLRTTGTPEWSAAPASGISIDPATGIVYTPIDIDNQVGLQPVNDYLLDISAADPAGEDDLFQVKTGHITNRTLVQVIADLVGAGLYEAIDPGTVVFSALGETLVAEPTEVAMVALIKALGGPIFDTHANRIAASHQKGVYWIENDTGLQFYDDGAAWRIISPLGQVLKLGAAQTINGDPLATPAATALRDVTELSFPVDAGDRWEVITHLWVQEASNASKLKLFWTLPGGAGDTFTIIKTGDLTTTATGTNPVLANVDAVSQMGSAGGIFEVITTSEITVGASAGTVQLRAAQVTAGGIGHDTIIHGQGTATYLTSSLRLRKLSAL